MNKFYDTPRAYLKMPQIGDNVIKTKGEIKGKFIITKEYTYYYLARSVRLGFKECFIKAGFFTGEYEVEKQGENFHK